MKRFQKRVSENLGGESAGATGTAQLPQDFQVGTQETYQQVNIARVAQEFGNMISGGLGGSIAKIEEIKDQAVKKVDTGNGSVYWQFYVPKWRIKAVFGVSHVEELKRTFLTNSRRTKQCRQTVSK